MILPWAIDKEDTEVLVGWKSGGECPKESTTHHCDDTKDYSRMLSWLAKMIICVSLLPSPLLCLW